MHPMTPRFDDYEDRILSLPADPSASDVTSDDFLLARKGRLEVFYAPLHGITPDDASRHCRPNAGQITDGRRVPGGTETAP